MGALLILAPALGSAISALIGAIGALGAVAGQAAAGGLAMLPGLIANAGIGIGVFKLATSGVSNAVGLMNKSNLDAANGFGKGGAAARANAQAVKAAADAVITATQGVQNARQSASLGAVSAARAVTSAEETLEHAIRTEVDAQRAIIQARKDAQEQAEALAFSVRGAAISTGEAEVAIVRAQENLRRVNLSPESSTTDKKEAELQLQRALLGLEEAKDRQKDLEEQKAQSDKKGIEGSDLVQQARLREAEAAEAQKKAEQGVTDAREAQ
jgi:hypothetical protein